MADRSSDVAQMLQGIDEAEAIDDLREEGAEYRRPQTPRHPSQVYSVRIPVERLAELRHYADEEGLTVSTLMRQLILQGLSRRGAAGSDDVEQLQDRVAELEQRMTVREKEHTERADQALDQLKVLSALLSEPLAREHG